MYRTPLLHLWCMRESRRRVKDLAGAIIKAAARRHSILSNGVSVIDELEEDGANRDLVQLTPASDLRSGLV